MGPMVRVLAVVLILSLASDRTPAQLVGEPGFIEVTPPLEHDDDDIINLPVISEPNEDKNGDETAGESEESGDGDIVGPPIEINPILRPGTWGISLVENVEAVIQDANIFPEDYLFFRRISFVESHDGMAPFTYRDNYHGGIWQVDEDMFLSTKVATFEDGLSHLIDLIYSKLAIRWSDVTWLDLERPLHSAIAARLYLYKSAQVPFDIVSQASVWASRYRSGGDPKRFIREAERLESGFCDLQLGEIGNLDYDSGRWLNIFVDRPLGCGGLVTQWEFYAKKKGTIFMSVWRPEGKGWRLLGKNKLSVRYTGAHVFHVARADQIEVEPSDVTGLHYQAEDEDEESGGDDRGIIPFQNSADFGWGRSVVVDPVADTEFQYSRIHNVLIYDDELPLGVYREGTRKFERVPAIAVYVSQHSLCDPTSCRNGGECSLVLDEDGMEDYQCSCPDLFVGKDCQYIQGCKRQGGPLENLNYNSGLWLNIFVDFEFECRGRITQWRFYAKQTGVVFLSVWRPGGGGWEIIGKNEIHVKQKGEHLAYIDEADQIEVEAGDVYGIHYPNLDDGCHSEDGRGIIPYTDTRAGGPGLCCGVHEDDLSEIHNTNVQDGVLPLGSFRAGLRDFRRAAALSAYVASTEPCEASLGPLNPMPRESLHLQIYVDRRFDCNGYVTKWEFLASGPGTVFLGVWRRYRFYRKWTLVGKNEIHVNEEGEQVFYIPTGNQIAAREGDVVGIHYPDSQAHAIINYLIFEDLPCCQADTEDLSRVYEDDRRDTELPASVHASGLEPCHARQAPLHAYLNAPSLCDSNPCHHGGVCSLTLEGDAGQDVTCDCPPGYIGEFCQYKEACSSAAGPLKRLNYEGGQLLNIFADYKFGCGGRVAEWRFYAIDTGTVFLSSWRQEGNNQMKLMGKNEITVTELGLQTAFISEADQLEVEPTDVLGIHYHKPTGDPYFGAIIPYTDTRTEGPGLCCDLRMDGLSRYVNPGGVYDNNLPVGATRPANYKAFVRAAAMSAHIYTPETDASPVDDTS